jgi:hypothetical protein
MRDLTSEMLAFIKEFNTEEYKAEQKIIQAEQAAAKAEQDKVDAEWLAAYEAKSAKDEALLKKLEYALRAAGIKLSVHGYYEGTWIKAELPDGTEMELEGYDIETFDDDLPNKEG